MTTVIITTSVVLNHYSHSQTQKIRTHSYITDGFLKLSKTTIFDSPIIIDKSDPTKMKLCRQLSNIIDRHGAYPATPMAEVEKQSEGKAIVTIVDPSVCDSMFASTDDCLATAASCQWMIETHPQVEQFELHVYYSEVQQCWFGVITPFPAKPDLYHELTLVRSPDGSYMVR
ncbi:MAG: hypothetical protein KF784_15245 [Fimbriimonadaceae bacterium]|nr:hypothetical protein [Fimbriimonadaceae bacterium]